MWLEEPKKSSGLKKGAKCPTVLVTELPIPHYLSEMQEPWLWGCQSPGGGHHKAAGQDEGAAEN